MIQEEGSVGGTWRSRVAILALLCAAACSGGGDSTGSKNTGGMVVTIVVDSGIAPTVTISGNGFHQVLHATTTISSLAAGQYDVDAADTAVDSLTYSAGATHQVITVAAGRVDHVRIVYAVASSLLQLNITGLPPGLNANLFVGRATGDSVIVNHSMSLQLPAGTNAITPRVIPNNDTTWFSYDSPGTYFVGSGQTVHTLNLAYAPIWGALQVQVTGLPGGAHASTNVTGPMNFSQTVMTSGTFTLPKLPVGNYSVSASPVSSGGLVYQAEAGPAVGPVTGGDTTYFAFGYQQYDLSIPGMYLTQSVQKFDESVPLVAGRDGILRVFPIATARLGGFVPRVRVRWYASGALVRTDTVAAPTQVVPTQTDESSISGSYNVMVPGAFIQPGLSVLADVDFDGAVAEAPSTNNSFPVNGTPLALDVRTADSARVTIIPIENHGHTGNPGNLNTYVALAMKIHPLPGIAVSAHAVYHTQSAGAYVPDDSDGAWLQTLTELDNLRTLEAPPAAQHYFGVVDVTYPFGVAGLGYIGHPVGIGWDGSQDDEVFAHETGHNWSLLHAPCGGPAGVDPNYPYQNGNIGVYGMDVAAQTIKQPSIYDLMSYCTPVWISDYNYKLVQDWRASNEDVVGRRAVDPPPGPALIVWGRMQGNRLTLEPSFVANARPSRPERTGEYTIEGLDAIGGTVFSYAFHGREVADAPGGAHTFVFAIPTGEIEVSRLAELRLRGEGVEVRRTGGAIVSQDAVGTRAPSKLEAHASGRGAILVTWDATAYPLAVVRDAQSGEVLSFARAGRVGVTAKGGRLSVTLSDGVRSVEESVIAR
jgi:hypothetical protein